MSHAIADRRKAETKRKPDGSLFGQVLGTHMANVIICIRIVWAIATFAAIQEEYYTRTGGEG